MQPVVRVELTMWVTSGQMTVFNGGGCRWASQCSKHHACKHVHDVQDLDHCLSLGARHQCNQYAPTPTGQSICDFEIIQIYRFDAGIRVDATCMHLSDSICLVFD
jgi:hypothetical protein